MEEGEPRIVSGVSAKAEMDARSVALGTQMEGPFGELRAAVAAGDSVFRKVAPGFGLQGGEATVAARAKFVRP